MRRRFAAAIHRQAEMVERNLCPLLDLRPFRQAGVPRVDGGPAEKSRALEKNVFVSSSQDRTMCPEPG